MRILLSTALFIAFNYRFRQGREQGVAVAVPEREVFLLIKAQHNYQCLAKELTATTNSDYYLLLASL